MSFYILKTKDYNLRNTEVLICSSSTYRRNDFSSFKDVQIYKQTTKFNHRYKKHLYVTDSPYIGLTLALLTIQGFSQFEYIVDDVNEELFVELEKHLLNNEASIGLLTKSQSIIKDNIKLINKYHVHIYKPGIKKIIKIHHQKITASKVFKKEKIHEQACYIAGPVRNTFDLDDSFKEKLFKYMNKSRKNNVEIYTKGGITRQVFSKILSLDNYLPKKPTIICLIIGMELNIDDALDLLNAAGYTLSSSIRFDKVVRKYIESSDFDLDHINIELEYYNEPILGWKPRED